MQQLICPLDGKPCETNCPDRYKDQPEGGCFLTTARELGGGDIGGIYAPSSLTGKEEGKL